MESLKHYQRLLLLVLLALLFACAASPWLALVLDWAYGRWPELIAERVPFSRIFSRAFMAAGILLLISYPGYLSGSGLKSLLAAGYRAGSRDVLKGLTLAIVSMVLLLVLMTTAGVYQPYFRYSFGAGAGHFAVAFLSGLCAGILEEIFFRGLLFRGLLEDVGAWRAYLLANGFYAALHFVKPGKRYFLDGLDPLAGFKHLTKTFAPFADPAALLPGVVGLFLIGAVLSFALVRTGTLLLAIGLHAGWVMSFQMVRVFGDFRRGDLGWAFGSTNPKILSGMVTWLVVLLTGAAVYWTTRRRAGRT